MTFSRLTIGTNIIATSKDKSIFYDGEFERVLTIKNVKNLIRLILGIEANSELEWAQGSQIKIVSVPRAQVGLHKDSKVHYFRADFEGKSYFIKHCLDPRRLGSGGYIEAVSTDEAEKILRDNKIEWANVVKFKLGYTDAKKKYYISEWCNQENRYPLDIYMKYLKGEIAVRELYAREGDDKTLDTLKKFGAELDKKLLTLQRLFDDYFDIHPHNIFIDIHSKQLYLFDLSKFPKQEK